MSDNTTVATKQASFTDPMDRSREVLRRLARQYDPDECVIASSGGTDSILAADVMCRLAPEYGIEPTKLVHINTGACIPQTELAAQIVAEMHDLEFVKQGYRNQRNALGPRVLSDGWPAAYGGHPSGLGHGREWANRKDKPMDAVYVEIDGIQVWVSGARKLESKKRQGSVPDSGIEKDKPRRVWCAVIGGWTDAEKRRYIRERGLPVSESYLLLGFSGKCVACSFDGQGLLTGIDLLCPELAYCIRRLAVWLYQRAKTDRVDIDPKQLCWGWEPGKNNVQDFDGDPDTAQEMVGCDPESCGGNADIGWVRDLPANQLVTRDDVTEWWASGTVPERFPV